MDSYKGIFCYGPKKNVCSALQDLMGCVLFFVFLLHASPQIKFEMECRFQKPMVLGGGNFLTCTANHTVNPHFHFTG